jgi:hypothetical protein
MKKGQIANLVVIVISLMILVSGILLVRNISKVTAALPSPQDYSFAPYVFPEKGQIGTVFTIQVITGTENRSDIYRMDIQISKDNMAMAEIPLLDDGLHGDGKAGDGVYANTFDSSGKSEGVYDVNLHINPIENIESYKNITSFQVFRQNCVNLRYTGNPSQKIDVVFVPSGYSDMKKFANDVIRFVDIQGKNKGLFALEPFKSNTDKFNLYLINQTEDMGCSLNCQGISSMICCNDNKVEEVASQCPADQIVVIQDTADFCGTASSYAKVCAISRGQEVFTHEWGHSFGGLGDEYDYSAYYPTYVAEYYDYPNCDMQGCPKWSSLGLSGTECFKGCGVSSAYRPTQGNCMMYGYVGQYDSVCALQMKKLMDNYSSQIPTGQMAPPIEKAYMINLNYNYGQLKLNDVYVTQTTAPDRKSSGRRPDYQAKLISVDGKQLYTFNFEIPRTENPFYNSDNDTFRPSPVVFTDVDRIIPVPYYANARKMEVYNLANKKVLEVDLMQFSNLCGDKICEQGENSVQCPADCSVIKSDKLCTYSKDNICDPDCMNIDPDCKTLSPLLIANVVALAVFIILFVLVLARKK